MSIAGLSVKLGYSFSFGGAKGGLPTPCQMLNTPLPLTSIRKSQSFRAPQGTEPDLTAISAALTAPGLGWLTPEAPCNLDYCLVLASLYLFKLFPQEKELGQKNSPF